MDLQLSKSLEKLASSQKVKFIIPYSDLMTEMSAECLVCGHKWDDFPQKFKNGNWCIKCNKNPHVLLERAFESIGITITSKNVKNMFDYLLKMNLPH